MATEYGTMMSEEEMLVMVDEMEEDQLREVAFLCSLIFSGGPAVS
jgi:hypothetical protein